VRTATLQTTQVTEGNKSTYIAYHNSQVYFEVVGVVYRTIVVLSDKVGIAFANEIMSALPADDRCRKFENYIDSGCDFAPDLWASSLQQSPTTTNAPESFHSQTYFFNRSHVILVYILTGSLAFTRATSRRRSWKAAQRLRVFTDNNCTHVVV